MSKTKHGFPMLSFVLLAGCGHSHFSGNGAEMVCTSRGRGGCTHYDYKYSDDARSLGESTHESLERYLAASSGTTYSPTKYASETPSQFAERSREESARQSAFQSGRPYSPPLRSSESVDHWQKRSNESTSLFDRFKRDSPGAMDSKR